MEWLFQMRPVSDTFVGLTSNILYGSQTDGPALHPAIALYSHQNVCFLKLAARGGT